MDIKYSRRKFIAGLFFAIFAAGTFGLRFLGHRISRFKKAISGKFPGKIKEQSGFDEPGHWAG